MNKCCGQQALVEKNGTQDELIGKNFQTVMSNVKSLTTVLSEELEALSTQKDAKIETLQATLVAKHHLNDNRVDELVRGPTHFESPLGPRPLNLGEKPPRIHRFCACVSANTGRADH